MRREYKYRGHVFSTEKQLIEAKKEAEAIEYLRVKTDFNKPDVLIKLYNKLLDRNMMETEVGMDFLAELRQRILDSGMFKEEQVRPVPPIKKATEKFSKKKKSKEEQLISKYRRQNALLKICCLFAVVVIIGMFVILLTGRRSPLADKYEEEIQNKYGAWSDELTEREERLKEILFQLEQQGITIPEEK